MTPSSRRQSAGAPHRSRARQSDPPGDDPAGWPVRRVVSAGGVVVRETDAGYEVALTRRRTLRGAQAWGLPKGTLEEGETIEQTALREVREETGLSARIVSELDSVTYWFAWPPDRARYRKTVHFFVMRATGGDPSDHDQEVEEVVFLPISEAARRASYGSEKKVIRKAADVLGDTESGLSSRQRGPRPVGRS